MKKSRKNFGAFDHGEVPTIACFNRATTALGIDLDKLIAAMQVYVDRHVEPVWGTSAQLVRSHNFVKGQWAMVFLDESDQPDDLAYHDLTPAGLPLAKVFVQSTLDNGDLVSVSASHELVEMLVDPAVNMMTTGPDPKTMYAYESADPVEALSFKVQGISMSNFVYPSYFESFRKRNSTQFDHMQAISKPFQILKGGYQIVFRHGKWGQLFASAKKQNAFQLEVRFGHRSETRKAGHLRRTSPKASPRRVGHA